MLFISKEIFELEEEQVIAVDKLKSLKKSQRVIPNFVVGEFSLVFSNPTSNTKVKRADLEFIDKLGSTLLHNLEEFGDIFLPSYADVIDAIELKESLGNFKMFDSSTISFNDVQIALICKKYGYNVLTTNANLIKLVDITNNN